MNFFLLIFLLLSITTKGEVNSASAKHQNEHKDHIKSTGKDEGAGDVDPMKIYQQFLRKKRIMQSTALQNLIHLKDVKQQNTMVKQILGDIHKILSEAKRAIDGVKFDPKSGRFPLDSEELREQIAGVIETTPYFCEFALYYPRVVKKEYMANSEFKNLIQWAYSFGLDFEIYDEAMLKLINLAGQELGIIMRQPDYVNPYDKDLLKEQMQWEAVEKDREAREERKKAQKEEAKLKKKVKGPAMYKAEL